MSVRVHASEEAIAEILARLPVSVSATAVVRASLVMALAMIEDAHRAGGKIGAAQLFFAADSFATAQEKKKK